MWKFVLGIVVSCFGLTLLAQKTAERGDLRIVFYNAENFFDAKNDSLTLDDDFTPQGKTHWTFAKYKRKTNRIAQVLMAIGGWEMPELIGLCEVENARVLKELTKHSPLARFKYSFVHFDSPDERGIDVALLYQKEKFSVLHREPIRIQLDAKNEDKTRDILYVKGVTNTDDTLHLFVNHWPSKYGGILETATKRNAAAKRLRAKTDSILGQNSLAKIIIMGDFNTVPTSEPIRKTLGAKLEWEKTENGLYNLSADWAENKNLGTHKFHGLWSVLDQFIVSGGVLKGAGILFTTPNDAHIFAPPFLLEADKYGGQQPFRTHIGMKYNNGFSDHLPIYLDLWRK